MGMIVNDLKPCPFCGGESFVRKLYSNYIVDAKHDRNCPMANMPLPYDTHWVTQLAAQAAWNRRVEEVDSAERIPHGCWQPSEIPHEKYVCSHCGGACWYYDYEGIVARSRFCPNCGAKMDEKE